MYSRRKTERDICTLLFIMRCVVRLAEMLPVLVPAYANVVLGVCG